MPTHHKAVALTDAQADLDSKAGTTPALERVRHAGPGTEESKQVQAGARSERSEKSAESMVSDATSTKLSLGATNSTGSSTKNSGSSESKSTGSSTTTTSKKGGAASPTAATGSGSKGLSTWAIVGIVAGSLLVVGAGSALAVMYGRKRYQARKGASIAGGRDGYPVGSYRLA